MKWSELFLHFLICNTWKKRPETAITSLSLYAGWKIDHKWEIGTVGISTCQTDRWVNLPDWYLLTCYKRLSFKIFKLDMFYNYLFHWYKFNRFQDVVADLLIGWRYESPVDRQNHLGNAALDFTYKHYFAIATWSENP